MAELAARIAAKVQDIPSESLSVKAHRGEPLNNGADDIADLGHTLEREGENYRWKERTSRLVYSYYDRNSCQWKKGTWSKTIRNTARRGAAESLMEARLKLSGANWWRTGLFEKRCEEMEEDWMQPELTWKSRQMGEDCTWTMDTQSGMEQDGDSDRTGSAS